MAMITTREIPPRSTVAHGRTRRECSNTSLRSITAGILMDERVWRKISRAICFVGGIAPPAISVFLEDIRVQHIGRALAFEQCDYIVRGHSRHLRTRLRGCRRQMRRENYIRTFETWMNEWFVFIDVQRRTCDFLVFERGH